MSNATSSRGVNVPSSGIRPGPSARTQDARNATKADQFPRSARRPAPLLDTPCYGKAELFDSAEFADHHEAKALCAHCPVLTSCVLLLEDVLRSTKPYGGPDGTWAGRGFNIGRKPGRPKTRPTRPTRAKRDPRDIPECGTETGYQRHKYRKESCDECRSAHTAHERAKRLQKREVA